MRKVFYYYSIRFTKTKDSTEKAFHFSGKTVHCVKKKKNPSTGSKFRSFHSAWLSHLRPTIHKKSRQKEKVWEQQFYPGCTQKPPLPQKTHWFNQSHSGGVRRRCRRPAVIRRTRKRLSLRLTSGLSILFWASAIYSYSVLSTSRLPAFKPEIALASIAARFIYSGHAFVSILVLCVVSSLCSVHPE